MDKLAKGNKEIGSALIAEASARYEKKRRDKVVQSVERLVQFKNECDQVIRVGKKCLDFYEAKIKAIEAGDFEFDLHSEAMRFHDETFNRERPVE